MAHSLQKLSVDFSTVAFFDVLVKNFYKVTQGTNEKVPSFTNEVGGDPQPNQITMPQENDRP